MLGRPFVAMFVCASLGPVVRFGSAVPQIAAEFKGSTAPNAGM